jgi:hypothetical protein
MATKVDVKALDIDRLRSRGDFTRVVGEPLRKYVKYAGANTGEHAPSMRGSSRW